MQRGVNQILERGVNLVIVKRGAEGATAYWKDGTDQVPAFRVNVVSSAGAGDSFDAGFIAARLRNADIHNSLIYANAVAAIKVTHQNARAVPTHDEVLAFLAGRNQQIVINQ